MDIGTAATQAGINGFFGLVNNLIGDIQGRNTREHTFDLNEQAAENADARTRKLYNDLYSVPAQLRQLKDAGLSPSVFYNGGASGISGQTGAQGAGAAGANFAAFGLSPLDISQIEVNKSIANKNNADADAARGDGAMGTAKLENILVDTANKLSQAGLNDASKALTNVQTANEKLNTLFLDGTLGDRIAQVNYQARKLYQESERALYETGTAKLNFEILDETKQELINREIQKTQQQIIDIYNAHLSSDKTKEEIKLTQEQEKQIQSAIEQKWEELKISSKNAESLASNVKNQKDFWDAEIKKWNQEFKIKEKEIDTDLIRTAIQAKYDVFGMVGLSQYNENTIKALEKERKNKK